MSFKYGDGSAQNLSLRASIAVQTGLSLTFCLPAQSRREVHENVRWSVSERNRNGHKLLGVPDHSGRGS